MEQYDLVVIGFGKAGKTLAGKLSAAGKKLKQKAEGVMHDVFCATECSPTELVTLKNQLHSLRDNLVKSLEE